MNDDNKPPKQKLRHDQEKLLADILRDHPGLTRAEAILMLDAFGAWGIPDDTMGHA